MVGISGGTLAKLSHNEFVSMDVIVKICRTLDCTVDDILEIMPDKSKLETASAEGGGNSGPQKN